MIAAIQEQAARLATVAPQHANDVRGEAARLISELAPPAHNKVFFTNGGADAIENAVRMARLHTGRHKVLSAYRSYHGNTVDRRDIDRRPTTLAERERHRRASSTSSGPTRTARRSGRQVTSKRPIVRLQHLEAVIQFEGPQTIAAIVLESVVGTAGVLIPPAHYLAGLRELATKYGIVYIADEVMAGFGRTGEWFAFDHFGVEPDLIAFAKGVNSGYVPVGGVIISDEIAATFDERVFPGGLTYSGHPLAAASIVATINAMREEAHRRERQGDRRERARPGLARAGRTSPGDRRGARVRCLLGARPGQGP